MPVFYLSFCCCLVAINALAVLEEMLDSSFNPGKTVRICTLEALVLDTVHTSVIDTVSAEELEDERHSHKPSVCRLLKVMSSGIVVNVNVDLIYSGEGMKDRKCGFCKLKLA